MTAATDSIDTKCFGDLPPGKQDWPMKTNTAVKAGWLIQSDGSGWAIAGATGTGLCPLGVAQDDADNTGGADGAKKVKVKPGVYAFQNSAAADAIARDDVGKRCYVVDNQTVALTDGTGTRSVAGIIVGMSDAGLPMVAVSPLFSVL